MEDTKVRQMASEWQGELPWPMEMPFYWHVRHAGVGAGADGERAKVEMDVISGENHKPGYLEIVMWEAGEQEKSGLRLIGQHEGESLEEMAAELKKVSWTRDPMEDYNQLEVIDLPSAEGDKGVWYWAPNYRGHRSGFSDGFTVEFVQDGVHVYLMTDVLTKAELVKVARNF